MLLVFPKACGKNPEHPMPEIGNDSGMPELEKWCKYMLDEYLPFPGPNDRHPQLSIRYNELREKCNDDDLLYAILMAGMSTFKMLMCAQPTEWTDLRKYMEEVRNALDEAAEKE